MKRVLAPALALTVAVGAASCGSKRGVSRQQLQEFSARAGLVIPPSARATDFRHPFGFHDQKMLLRLQLPRADLAAFLSQSGLDGELRNTTRTEAAPAFFGDFLPAHPVKFREGQKSLPGGQALNVLVDEDSPTEAVVYLLWFET